MEDKPRFADGIRAMSGASRYMRFFSQFTEAPDSVLDRLVDVDGQNHIAWCAIEEGSGLEHPVAAVHAVRYEGRQDTAELAIAVVDTYQGQGVSRILLALVLNDCMTKGYAKCVAHILAKNEASTHLFLSLGSRRISQLGSEVLYSLQTIEALEILDRKDIPAEIAEIIWAR